MQDADSPRGALTTRRSRISEDMDFEPWVPSAQDLSGISLFWMPVSSYPWPHDEKVWISEFLLRFSRKLEQEHRLRAEVFLQYKSLSAEQSESFRKYAQKSLKLVGLGRFSNEDVPSFPTEEQVKEATRDGKSFDFREWIADYLFWFASKDAEQQRTLFAGLGGMTTIFLLPDPKIAPPPINLTPALRASLPMFQRFDVDSLIAGTHAMRDAFLEKSKVLFGAGLEDKAEWPGIMFVLPLLTSSHFFTADEQLRSSWFELFDVYVTESKKDKGILLAFRKPAYRESLREVLDEMRGDGLRYGRMR